MKVDVLGSINITAWDLIPDHSEANDGSYMVFKTVADDDMLLYVSTITLRVRLCLKCGQEWDVYNGYVDNEEYSALCKIYAGGCYV